MLPFNSGNLLHHVPNEQSFYTVWHSEESALLRFESLDWSTKISHYKRGKTSDSVF